MIAIKVPPLGESIVEATVSRWLKQEGDAVAAGETLVELETDKITVEVPALKAGILSSRARAEGEVVVVDDVLGQLDEGGSAGAASAGAAVASATDPAPAPHDPIDGPVPVPPMTDAGEPPPPPPQDPSDGPAPVPTMTRSAPAARRTADEAGVNIASVTGSGRGGVVSKTDVLGAIASKSAAVPAAAAAPAAPAAPKPPAAPAPARTGERETREKMTTRRKRIAENLLQAQHNTAHLTTFNEIDMSAVTALRTRLKDKVEKEHGVKLSFMPFFVKAATHALKAFPLVNAQIDGDSIVYKHYVNMGIAVASDAGLVVPNVKDADAKGMLDISRDIAALANKARTGKLAMDDLTGGTFTITNGGVFGSLISTPIINYPQVAILGLHKTQDRPVAIDGKVEVRPMMYVALSYDHRIIDGQQAVLFLVRIKELMEDPASMLVG
ncbi:MAG TPA: 2-oxoglutarate dehydrogenase complex dihydrolipoyllysine-residue succinyltransferase [Gemmatimonadaceae bacterium]|nr:2-oxoglutarate dehydrogenase complex dihydrolipoyllysine-residue succinyltransferase [Gemmatimonadaceae bacterium]